MNDVLEKEKNIRKAKYGIMVLLIGILLFLIPNISKATVGVTRNIYSNNGSMKFYFTGLTLDTNHEYEYGLTKTKATEVVTWHLVTEWTANTLTADVTAPTKDLREVINAVDTGYITIRDKSTSEVILQPYAVDLKIPFLKVTNYTVIPNGKQFSFDMSGGLQILLRSSSNSKPYYQYEKITDQNIINKYKEIKAKNGDFTTLQNMLKTTVPTSNWSSWDYWNGSTDGYGHPQRNIAVPDTGLYYMWVYSSGKDIKDMYGYVLVDNLEPDIALESISLDKTAKVELGTTRTLIPSFNPSNATNKIVTWTSSDETVATVDNAGKITPKKLGSTIITVTSQDGKKKATCTVTVTENQGNNNQGSANSSGNGDANGNTGNPGGNINIGSSNGNSNNGSTSVTKNDSTMATGKLPQTGVGVGLTVAIISVLGIVGFTFFKYRNLRGV